MDFPAEVIIPATIRPGSVYSFAEETFVVDTETPHYFIVMNVDPSTDSILFLVYASSKIDKVKLRCDLFPPETLVEIQPSEYKSFTVPSIINCNHVVSKDKTVLIDKFSKNQLTIWPEMDMAIVKRLRQGILASPRVDRYIRARLSSNL